MVNKNNATCLPGTGVGSTSLNQSFQEFLKTCASPEDMSRMENLITFQSIKEIFEQERSNADDLIRSLQNLRTLKNTAKLKIEELATKHSGIDNDIEVLKEKIAFTEQQVDAANEQFMETITEAPTKSHSLANFQDLALGVFFTSLFILTILFTIVQWMRPDGGFMTALMTFGGMVLLSLIVYALLKEVA
jgi:hypothetical protein